MQSLKLSLLALAFVSMTSALVPSGARLSVARQAHARCQQSSSALSMKLFDWKRREADESSFAHVDSLVFDETNLKPAPGSHKRKLRKGRGIAAGQGATCGFGMRGQSSRSGRPERPGFEGGQQPLYRRIPKYRGRPLGPGHKRTVYNPIKLDLLNAVSEGSTVSFDSLLESKVLQKSKLKIHKVVGGGELTVKGLTVQAHAFTQSARSAIEDNGGTCVVLSRTTNLPVEDDGETSNE